MKGYQEAEKINVLINKVVDKYPLEIENIYEYANFVRTIETSLLIIKLTLNEKLTKEKENENQ